MSFDKLVTLEAGPLEQKRSDAVLRDYTPWFNSGALGEGYASKDDTVWKSGDAITWDSTFGRRISRGRRPRPHRRMPTAGCPVLDAQCPMPSARCPLPDDRAPRHRRGEPARVG
ncbi:hypothetical protein WMF38_20345 [Sorangium sp. So ce118]